MLLPSISMFPDLENTAQETQLDAWRARCVKHAQWSSELRQPFRKTWDLGYLTTKLYI